MEKSLSRLEEMEGMYEYERKNPYTQGKSTHNTEWIIPKHSRFMEYSNITCEVKYLLYDFKYCF